ncbi:MAG: 2'-5' RNA ligase family protein [Methanomassiliicoccales archaeon]
MRYAIVLYLDEKSETRLCHLQEKMVQEGLSAVLPESQRWRPHLTLIKLGGVEDEPLLLDLLRRYAYERAPLGLRMESLGVFLDLREIFLAPAPTSALLKDHEDLYDRADRQQMSAERRYSPDCWTPHVTIVDGVARERLGRAVQIASENLELPMVARVISIGVLRISQDSSRIEKVREFDWGR